MGIPRRREGGRRLSPFSFAVRVKLYLVRRKHGKRRSAQKANAEVDILKKKMIKTEDGMGFLSLFSLDGCSSAVGP